MELVEQKYSDHERKGATISECDRESSVLDRENGEAISEPSHSTVVNEASPNHSTEHNIPDEILDPSERWHRRRILFLYLVTTTLLYADLNLMAPNLSDIADEFGFDDDERDVKLGGTIALAFFLVGSPVALLVGWLADFVPRSPLYGVTVLLGEAACLATYFIQTYPQLVAMRTLTGVSIGGSLPVIYSVLGDLYPAQKRNAVSAIISFGMGLGIGMGRNSRLSWRRVWMETTLSNCIQSWFGRGCFFIHGQRP